MAVDSGALTDPAAADRDFLPAEGFRGLRWWVQVLLIYAASRVITTTMIVLLSRMLGPGARAGANPAFFNYTTLWDGEWYWYISAVGYPSQLPVNAAGHVLENQWAFMPVYPGLVAGLSTVSGLAWPVMAFLVSLSFGFAAALMLYRLFRLRLPHSPALFGVVLFSVAPLSFIQEMAYPESLYLFLLISALYLLMRRRYGWLFPLVAVMAFTRPSGLAFALAVGLHFVYRLVTRSEDPFGTRERTLAGSLAIFSAVMGFGWLLIAWAVTGSITAYTDTEVAWRAAVIGYGDLVPFTPWFQAAQFWLGWPLGAIVVVLLAVGFAALLFLPAVKRLGVDLRFWLASYGLYLFAVFFPQSSVFRLLMPMFPLLGALAQPRSVPYRISLVVVSLALQWFWLWTTWGPREFYWSVP